MQLTNAKCSQDEVKLLLFKTLRWLPVAFKIDFKVIFNIYIYIYILPDKYSPRGNPEGGM